MLWRLHLLGEDVSALPPLLQGWAGDAHAGHYAFNDVHAVLALLAPARWRAPRPGWRAAPSARWRPTTRGRSNHAMAREVGLPLMRGLLALARGDADAAADTLYPLRALAQRFGGSHAQRDLIDQTLLAAAARGSRRALGRALLNERLMAKPADAADAPLAQQPGPPCEASWSSSCCSSARCACRPPFTCAAPRPLPGSTSARCRSSGIWPAPCSSATPATCRSARARRAHAGRQAGLRVRVDQVQHDGGGFVEHQLAVHQHRDQPVRVELQVGGRLVRPWRGPPAPARKGRRARAAACAASCWRCRGSSAA
jgi:hypothetical protein